MPLLTPEGESKDPVATLFKASKDIEAWKYVRTESRTAVDKGFELHKKIAAENKVPLFGREGDFRNLLGAHDFGRIRVEKKAVTLFDRSNSLTLYDASGSVYQEPLNPVFFEGHDAYLKAAQDYKEAWVRARTETARLLLPIVQQMNPEATIYFYAPPNADAPTEFVP